MTDHLLERAINDLLKHAVSAASDDPRRVAPEFGWELKAGQWRATDRDVCKATFGARPARVVVTPGKPAIYVHGAESRTWLAYLNGGTQPRGEDFKRCLAELAARVGLDLPAPVAEWLARSSTSPARSSRPARRSTPAAAAEVPIEPIPAGKPEPFEDLWPFKGADRVHRYAWGFVVCRKEVRDGAEQKAFYPCRPSPLGLIIGTRTGTYAYRGGCWMTPKDEPGEKLRGIPGVDPEALITYRYRQALEAVHSGALVWFCEGEKDVEALEALANDAGEEIAADTNPGGAGKLTPEQARIYDGARVAIIPDNDDPDERGHRAGLAGAERNGQTLIAAGAEDVRILEPLGDGGGYDLTDFIADRRKAGAEPDVILQELELRRRRAPKLEPRQDPEPAPAPAGPEAENAAQVAADLVLDAADLIERAKEDPESVYGIKTGIPRLDALTLGLHPGLIILAAPPSLGKTTLAQAITLNACQADQVLYLSWEHTAPSLVRRMLCSRAGIDTMALRRGRFDYEAMIQAHRELEPHLRHLEVIARDLPALTMADVGARIRAARAREPGRRLLLVVDFLQLHAKGAREFRQMNDPRGKVEALGAELKNLADTEAVPVLAISAQARGGDGYADGKGSARLDTLKESGDTEYSADLVLFLTLPDEDDAPDNERVLHLKKHREGPTGKIPLVFDLKSGQVREKAPEPGSMF